MTKQSKKPKPEGLTHRQRFFVLEFLVDGNQTRAAKAAGYTQDDAAAAVQGSRLLRNAKVKAEIARHAAARASRLELDGDQVLIELKKLALSDLREMFDEKGCLLPADQWPDGHALAVQSVEVFEEFQKLGRGFYCIDCQRDLPREFTGYTKKIKFWDKPKALELLGKNKKLFTDRVELEAGETLADLIAASGKASEDKKT